MVVSNLTASSIALGTNTPITNWPSGGGTAVDGTYPALCLELGGIWTDFEIKASTNNFTNLVYYYISSATNATADDTNVFVYISDDYQTDVRKWVKATNNTPIYNQLISPGSSVVNYVYAFPSHDCIVNWSTWMSKTNKNLIWSWVRFDGIEFETNAIGNQIWNLVRPDSWEVERTTP